MFIFAGGVFAGFEVLMMDNLTASTFTGEVYYYRLVGTSRRLYILKGR